jgi:hypothetical protein
MEQGTIILVVIRYGTHVMIGTSLFFIVAVPAVLLDLLVQRLDALGISEPVLLLLGLFEYFLLVFDVLISTAYIGFSALTIFKESCRE